MTIAGLRILLMGFVMLVLAQDQGYAYPYTRSTAQIPMALGRPAGETRFGLYYDTTLAAITAIKPISFFLGYAFSNETEVNLRFHQGETIVYGLQQRLFDYGAGTGITDNAVSFGLRDFSTITSPSMYVIWSGDLGWVKLHAGMRMRDPFGTPGFLYAAALSLPSPLGELSLDYDGINLSAGTEWYWGIDFLVFRDLEFSASAIGVQSPSTMQFTFSTNYLFNSLSEKTRTQKEDFERLHEKVLKQQEEIRFMNFFVDEYLYRIEATKPEKVYESLATSENTGLRYVGESDVASFNIEEVRAKRLNEIADHFMHSFELVYQKKYYEAIGELLEAQKINPEEAEVYKRIGSIYYTLGLYEKARDYYREALIRDPNDRQVQQMLIKANKRIVVGY